ncbi:MAG: MFS transporter [Candidatus Marsarchaeota archaeon]|nr:MFS transporter [Candidatus Marsarchaeota archaeon]
MNEKLVLAILVLGTMMGAIDSTIVLLALPAITQELSANLAVTIWTIIIYLLVIAVAITQFGRLGDIYGRSKMFNAGFAIFTIGSFLCGFSSSAIILVGFRVIQAIGGAFMQANSGAIIADNFEVGRRGKAYGFLALGWNIGAMLGIILGGAITTFIGWRYIFFINVPIGIVATFLGIRYLADKVKFHTDLDLPGMLLLGVALFSFAYGAVDFAGSGTSMFNSAMIAVGLLLTVLFFIWEGKAKNPMLPLSEFKNKVLTASILAALFQAIGFLAITFIIIMYLQGVRGLDPFSAALLFVPGYVISSVLAPYFGRLSDKYGARVIATVGIAITCAAVLVYLTLTDSSAYYIIIIASVLSGIGGSMFWPANNNEIMSEADAKHYGAISGVMRLTSNIGALLSYVIILTAASASVSRQVAFEVFVGTSKLIGGVSQSFLTGIHSALYASVALLAIAGILSLVRGRGKISG